MTRKLLRVEVRLQSPDLRPDSDSFLSPTPTAIGRRHNFQNAFRSAGPGTGGGRETERGDSKGFLSGILGDNYRTQPERRRAKGSERRNEKHDQQRSPIPVDNVVPQS